MLLRLEFDGAIYDVTYRSNALEDIFDSNAEKDVISFNDFKLWTWVERPASCLPLRGRLLRESWHKK